MTSVTVDLACLDEALDRMADDLGISRPALFEALTLLILDRLITAAALGAGPTHLPSEVTEDAIALVIGYLYPGHPAARQIHRDLPTTRTAEEFCAALEGLASREGADPAEIIRFLRKAAELRIGDSLTILRLVDDAERLMRRRPP
jgi:DNA-binding FadR family transcriptional regulator